MSVPVEDDPNAFAASLADFENEIVNLGPKELRSKAIAANNIRFVQSLQDDGYEPEEVTLLFKILARRFAKLGLRAPERGLYDLNLLGELDPVARRYRRLRAKGDA